MGKQPGPMIQSYIIFVEWVFGRSLGYLRGFDPLPNCIYSDSSAVVEAVRRVSASLMCKKIVQNDMSGFSITSCFNLLMFCSISPCKNCPDDRMNLPNGTILTELSVCSSYKTSNHHYIGFAQEPPQKK